MGKFTKGDLVRINDRRSKFMGQQGKIYRWDERRGKWIVDVATGKRVAFFTKGLTMLRAPREPRTPMPRRNRAPQPPSSRMPKRNRGKKHRRHPRAHPVNCPTCFLDFTGPQCPGC